MVKEVEYRFRVAIREREQPRDRLTLRERARLLRDHLTEPARVKLARLDPKGCGQTDDGHAVRISRRAALQVGEASDDCVAIVKLGW